MESDQTFQSEILGKGLALGCLADNAIFGLEEYLRCKRNNSKISERGKKLINQGIKLIEIYQEGLQIKEERMTIDKLSSWEAIHYLQIDKKKIKKIYELVLNAKKLKEIIETLSGIIEGRDVNEKRVLEIEKDFTLISGIYLHNAFTALESSRSIPLVRP